jgi:hypothetical protein
MPPKNKKRGNDSGSDATTVKRARGETPASTVEIVDSPREHIPFGNPSVDDETYQHLTSLSHDKAGIPIFKLVNLKAVKLFAAVQVLLLLPLRSHVEYP